MTGKELILYILQNNLEDEQISFENGFLDFITVNEAAAKYEVGPETVKIWFALKIIDGVQIGNEVYILPNAKPRY
jgi:hypothetical protein